MTKFDPEITVILHPDDTEVRGNAMASDDPELDKQVEDEIIERINNGDVWAWCLVQVRAEFRGMTASDYLGGCSYKDEQDFMQPGCYYEDMVATAVSELADMIEDLQGVEINRKLPLPTDAPVTYQWK